MGKRKQTKDRVEDEQSDDGSSDVSLINVDFDFFDPNPKVDYLALKRLLVQLFQSDADLFALNELTDLILSQPLVGTTIKTDGIESDPYAYLTVLNMHVHQNHASIKALREYILAKSSAHPALHAELQRLLGPDGLKTDNHVGILFSERLINMPVQVVPPMYRMLADEIKWAIDEAEPYKFTHYLIPTRTYRLTSQQAAELTNDPSRRPSKKARNQLPLPEALPPSSVGSDSSSGQATYSFHPEDEYIQKYASYTLDYPLSSQSQHPREEDSFGLDVAARLMLVPAENFPSMIEEMSQAYAVPQ